MKQILITSLFLIVLIIISGCEYLPSVEEEIIKNNASEFVIEPKIISPERLESLRRRLVTPETLEEEAITSCINDTICSETFSKYPFCVNENCVECKKNNNCNTGKICSDKKLCVECYLNKHCKERELCYKNNCEEIPKEIELRYCKYGVKGTRGIISFETYKSLNDKLSKIERSISYYPGIDEEPNEKDFLLKFINHKEQLIEIRKLASIIKGLSNSTQERARIAITMIQMIPYDNKAAKDDFHIERYPYEVLFDQTGICGEKSKFMAMLLKELQFGTAYIIFPEENHAITGIKCAKEYSFKESGYCFVESTKLTEIGQSDGSYVDVGRLKSIPQIIKISEGQTYEDIKVKYDQYLKGLEEGTHVLITDRFNNKLIRIVSPDYTDIINNPDVIISYGDNTVEYLN